MHVFVIMTHNYSMLGRRCNHHYMIDKTRQKSKHTQSGELLLKYNSPHALVTRHINPGDWVTPPGRSVIVQRKNSRSSQLHSLSLIPENSRLNTFQFSLNFRINSKNEILYSSWNNNLFKYSNILFLHRAKFSCWFQLWIFYLYF